MAAYMEKQDRELMEMPGLLVILKKTLIGHFLQFTLKICKTKGCYKETRQKKLQSVFLMMISFINCEKHDKAKEIAQKMINKGKMALEDNSVKAHGTVD